jgi:hypothetical protein
MLHRRTRAAGDDSRGETDRAQRERGRFPAKGYLGLVE